MKKLLSLVLAVIMVVSMTACAAKETKTEETKTEEAKATAGEVSSKDSENASEPKETVTLRMWGGVPPENGPQQVCDNFNELYKDKGIQVEYERFVNDSDGNLKLDTYLLSGTGVDLYMTYAIDVLSQRATSGLALDLTELMARDNFKLTDYFGSMAEAFYVDGNPYSIPTKLDQYGIVLNKTMFDEAGIEIPTEWTFDEFREIAKKLTKGEGDNKTYGMFWNSQQDLTYIFTYLAVQTLGGDPYYKSETESNFDNEVNYKCVELINNMMNVDGSAPTHSDSVTQSLTQEAMFLSGRSAMTVGPWIVRSIKDTTNYPHDFETAFAPYPVVAEGQRNFTQGGYGDHLCINPNSENTEAAWEFAKWYATEGMLPVVAGGRVPSSNTFNADEVVAAYLSGAENLIDADSAKKIIITPVDNYAVPSITKKNAEINQIIKEEIELILISEQTVEEGLASAKERADKILNE